MLRGIWLLAVVCGGAAVPEPPGRMVDLGGHRLHVWCTGTGAPTVVVENGLGDYSFAGAGARREVRACLHI